ncbi:MAG: alpha-glucan phosphorylase [Chloroflexi bacterium]|nr:alpha-glucan phosphorylase [Chloroflexota bacterium]
MKALDVAYFSMEVAVDPAVPTYSGGLGVLAGDTLRSAADLGHPMVGVTLLYRQGYFHQLLDEHGRQSEEPVSWSPKAHLEPVDARCQITIEGRIVQVRAWRYLVHGVTGSDVPVYFLDTAVEENDPIDRELTGTLYGGDGRYRLCQELLLGVGGLGMLRALGYRDIPTYHMNEGHAALLPLALLLEEVGDGDPRNVSDAQRTSVRNRCVFTTHTPIAAGHDRFPIDLLRSLTGDEHPLFLAALPYSPNGELNMTHIALACSRYVNAVSQLHQETSEQLFPDHVIHAITNGVHAVTWTSPPIAALYDEYVPQWRRDQFYLRHAGNIPLTDVLDSHFQAKAALLAETERRTGTRLDPKALTIGFARRAAVYKRPDFLFSDLDRLKRIVDRVGPLQVIFGGKAHPRDDEGKRIIERIYQARGTLGSQLCVAYLDEYDVTLGKVLCAGVDLWLNNPQKPHEASGTSGMKAALNGVPSLSVLDGWWNEGHVEGATGWSIGESADPERAEDELASLYDKLEYVIAPLFYRQPLAYASVMRGAMVLNGSFFNTQRMLLQYIRDAYSTREMN